MECTQPQHVPSVFKKTNDGDSLEKPKKTDSCIQCKLVRRKKGIFSKLTLLPFVTYTASLNIVTLSVFPDSKNY